MLLCNLSFSTDHDKLTINKFSLSGPEELKTTLSEKMDERIEEFEIEKWEENRCIMKNKIAIHILISAMIDLGWKIDHMAMSLHPTSPTDIEIHSYVMSKKAPGLFSLKLE
mmetsp:Transcript_261/g.549  ORF Transcript_261/g.549 Transcript_261/m.549 type:complete len:111 (+) Transcript_261:205-537(+)